MVSCLRIALCSTLLTSALFAQGHDEQKGNAQAPVKRSSPGNPGVQSNATVTRGPFTSYQVNVNATGANISGDAANEPSIAISPLDPKKMVIGWRQFDVISSNFRQNGRVH